MIRSQPVVVVLSVHWKRGDSLPEAEAGKSVRLFDR